MAQFKNFSSIKFDAKTQSNNKPYSHNNKHASDATVKTNERQFKFSAFTHLSNSQLNSLNQREEYETRILYSRSSRIIWDYYRRFSQTDDCYAKKVELKKFLYSRFKNTFQNLGVYIVGSSANGFGSKHSDVDICMMVQSDQKFMSKDNELFLLQIIERGLQTCPDISQLELIDAKVPIVKFQYSKYRIDCDVNLNNHVGIRNTHLLNCYNNLDWRVGPLVIFIKKWAKFHNINDASHKTLSSYSLTLMVIFYLQSVCKPSVLPVLQQLFPEKFNIDLKINTLKLEDELTCWTSENTQSLGELLAGFLEYYSNFKFTQNVISIRTGKLFDKSYLTYGQMDTRYTEWNYILIEEPFNFSNTARSVFDERYFEQIVQVFRNSNQILKQTNDASCLLDNKFDFMNFLT